MDCAVGGVPLVIDTLWWLSATMLTLKCTVRSGRFPELPTTSTWVESDQVGLRTNRKSDLEPYKTMPELRNWISFNLPKLRFPRGIAPLLLIPAEATPLYIRVNYQTTHSLYHTLRWNL